MKFNGAALHASERRGAGADSALLEKLGDRFGVAFADAELGGIGFAEHRRAAGQIHNQAPGAGSGRGEIAKKVGDAGCCMPRRFSGGGCAAVRLRKQDVG